MRNLLFTISYDGTAYHGWQVQENAPTVQQTVQDALEIICGTRDNITGCSRTDSGVHAEEFCFNMRTECPLECGVFARALDANLPRDIAVRGCREVDFDFHARYDCKEKEYTYKVWNSPEKNPFIDKYSLHHPYPLDVLFLDAQAKQFTGTHDFSAFCASGSSVEDKVRTVYSFDVERKDKLVEFRIRANGYLYNMVRIAVGTLIDISAGKIPADSIPGIISSLDRERAGQTAKAKGLFLSKVIY